MAIITRLIGLFKADIHGIMDQLEDRGLLLKQHLRDMEESLTHKEAGLKKMLLSRNQAQHEYDRYKHKAANLEHDLNAALQKDRDDIARMLIKKLKPLTNFKEELRCHLENLNQEITRFKDGLEQQRLQYERLKHKASDYFHRAEQKEWEKTVAAFMPNSITQEFSEEEVELELLQRKQLLKGGAVS